MNLSKQYCEEISAISTSNLFRFGHFLFILWTALACLVIMRLYRAVWPKLTFHLNLKVLLWFFFVDLMVYSVWTMTSSVLVLYSSLTIIHPCDVFFKPITFAIFHIPLVFTQQFQVWLQTAICVERLIATIRVKTYEKLHYYEGVWVLIAAVLFPVSITLYMYWGETFVQPQLVFHLPPSTVESTPKMHSFTVLSILNVVISGMVLYHNRKFRKKTDFPLNVRFQLLENIRSSNLVLSLSLVTAGIYLCAGMAPNLLFNNRQLLFGDDDIMYYAAKNFIYLIPFNALLISLLTIWMFHNYKKKTTNFMLRNSRITAKDATDTYRNYFKNTWM